MHRAALCTFVVGLYSPAKRRGSALLRTGSSDSAETRSQNNQSIESHDVLQHCSGIRRSEVALCWGWCCMGSSGPSKHHHSPKHWGSHLHPVCLSQWLRTSKTWILASGCLLQPQTGVWPHVQLCHWEPHFTSPLSTTIWVNPVYSCPIPPCKAGKWADARLWMSNHISYSGRGGGERGRSWEKMVTIP